ncbi:MAG: SurA N-terminal domain-containing protein [Ruminobacter sp.]|nr:SurA N-terminal domain-containing protein [Ruminobacter sp.]
MSCFDKLREGSTGWPAKVLFFLIAASFVIAGVGSYLIPDRNLDPAKVNDVKIPEHELENQVRREKAMLERQFGKQFFEKQMAVDPQFNNKFKASILEKLINDEALAQHIKKVGIDIPTSLVKAKIMSMPEFMVDGKFSQEQYEKVLSMYGYMTGEVFGETLRNNMSRETYLRPVIDGEFALPGEVQYLTDVITEKRTYSRVDVDFSKFKSNDPVSEKEISDYYEQNKDKYLVADKVKFSYIYLTSDDVKSDVHYTDADLTGFFNLHSEIYTIPEKREISHILLTGDDAMAKAAEIKAKIDSGEDFAALAKQYSEDKDSAANGGKLPAFSSGNQDSSIDKATFALEKVGDVSDPVESQYGVHIIKLNAIIPQSAKTFEDSKEDVIKRYVKQQSKEVFLDKRQIVADISFEDPDSLDRAAKMANESDKEHPSDNVKVQVYDYLASDAKDLKFPFTENEVKTKLFDKELRESGVNSDVIELGQDAFIVVHIEDYVPKTPKKLEDVKNEITADIAANRAAKNAESYVNDLLSKISKGESLDSEKAAGKITISEPKTIDRLNNDVDETVSKNVFEMARAPEGKVSFGKYSDADGKSYLLILSKVEKVDEKDASRDEFLNKQVFEFNAKNDNELVERASRGQAKVEYNRTKEYLKLSDSKSEEL